MELSWGFVLRLVVVTLGGALSVFLVSAFFLERWRHALTPLRIVLGFALGWIATGVIAAFFIAVGDDGLGFSQSAELLITGRLHLWILPGAVVALLFTLYIERE